jgi:hypothetical protein
LSVIARRAASPKFDAAPRPDETRFRSLPLKRDFQLGGGTKSACMAMSFGSFTNKIISKMKRYDETKISLGEEFVVERAVWAF